MLLKSNKILTADQNLSLVFLPMWFPEGKLNGYLTEKKKISEEISVFHSKTSLNFAEELTSTLVFKRSHDYFGFLSVSVSVSLPPQMHICMWMHFSDCAHINIHECKPNVTESWLCILTCRCTNMSLKRIKMWEEKRPAVIISKGCDLLSLNIRLLGILRASYKKKREKKKN